MLGKPGDFYLRATTSELFGPKNTNNTWGSGVNLKGVKGDPGHAGVYSFAWIPFDWSTHSWVTYSKGDVIPFSHRLGQKASDLLNDGASIFVFYRTEEINGIVLEQSIPNISLFETPHLYLDYTLVHRPAIVDLLIDVRVVEWAAADIVADGGIFLVFFKTKEIDDLVMEYQIPVWQPSESAFSLDYMLGISPDETTLHINVIRLWGSVFEDWDKDYIYQFRYITIPKGADIAWQQMNYDQIRNMLNLED